MSWISNIVDTIKKVVETIREAALQQSIDAAEKAVHTAATNYRKTGSETDKQAYITSVNQFLELVGYDLRRVALSDGDAAIAREISRFKAQYQGSQAEKDVLFPLLDETGAMVQRETPQQRELKVKIHDGQALVDTTRSDLGAAQTKLDGLGTGPAHTTQMAEDRQATQDDLLAKQAAFAGAVGNLLNLELDVELSNMTPAGPNGTYTPAQWQQAADKVKARYGATGESAVAIDQLALTKSGAQDVQVWLDKLKADPNSFTAAERKLAETNPISFAFIKALGITLDPDALSGDMKTLAEQDPVLFAILQKSGVKIRIDNKAPEEVQAAPLTNGKYLYITIGDSTKPIPVTPEMVHQYEAGGLAGLAPTLLPKLSLDKNVEFQRLAGGADLVRGDWLDAKVKELMDAGKSDEAIKLLGINLPEFFSPEAGAAAWEASGRLYLEPIFKADLDKFNFDDEAVLTDIAAYMNQKLDGASPETAALLLDLVMDRVSTLGRQAMDDNYPISGTNDKFLTAMSRAVQLADQVPGNEPTAQAPGVYARKVGSWMLDSKDIKFFGQETIGSFAHDIEQTGNSYLAAGLLFEAQSRPNQWNPDLVGDFQHLVEGAIQKRGDDIQRRINKQAYLDFMKNPDEVLQPFFDEFANDPNIGRKVRIDSETMLRDIIGKTMHLPPTNPEAAKNLDYTQEWYSPGTVEWNIIASIFDGIRSQGGDNPLLNALPIKLVSDDQGVQDGGIFVVTKPNGEDVVIDGMAIMASVLAAGGTQIDPDDMNVTWHYTDFKTFQEDNYYDDDGTIYLPKDMTLQDADGDGHADYDGEDAAITTAKERTQMGLGIGGIVLMFVPGAQGLGLALLAGGAILSADRLITMNAQGANAGWSNPIARAEWMNIIGSSLVLTRVGVVAGVSKLSVTSLPFKFLNGTQKVLGMGASYVGFTQTLGQAQYLATNWRYMDWGEAVHAGILLGGGILQMGFGARELAPFKWGPRRVPQTTQPSLHNLIQQRAHRIWEQAGKPEGQADVHWQQAWQSVKDEAVSRRAYQLWEDAGRPDGQDKVHWDQATQEFQAKIADHAYALWEQAGKPHGQNRVHWDAAEYAVYRDALLPATTTMPTIRQHFANWAGGFPQAFKGYFGKKGETWDTQLGRNGLPRPEFSPKNIGHAHKKFWEMSWTGAKQVGWSYAIVNGAGLALGTIYNFGLREKRRDGAPDFATMTPADVDAQMQAFMRDPDVYLDAYYEDAFFGVGWLAPDWSLYNFNGHLLSFTEPDGSQVFFRRVPADLFEAYKKAHGITGDDRVFLPAQTINLNDYPGFAPHIEPPDSFYNDADANYGGDIGRAAYAEWVRAWRPRSNVAADYWTNLEQTFGVTTSVGAYEFWKTHGRPQTGADEIWGKATQFYQDGINAAANQLWVQSGSKGTGPSQAQIEQAQDKYAPEIGAKAYELWLDGKKPAGVVTSQFWTDAEATFSRDQGQPAFDIWKVNKPENLNNEIWVAARETQVDKLWDDKGRPVEITVELRAPWREEPFQDAFLGDADGGAGPTGRWRGNFGFGPVEGLRPHVDLEGTFLYPYNQPTVSTLRFGLRSPTTSSWGVGLRQQNTTIWNQARISAGAVDYNRFQVYDLTQKEGGAEWDVMDGRFYLAIGNRDRIRLDYGGGTTYARIRETGFVEFGAGLDFIKYAYGDATRSVNGYYELQFYAPDLRAQVNLYGGKGDYTRGLKDIPPLFEIDPALQFSTTDRIPFVPFDIPRILDVPVLSGEDR